MFLDDSGTEIMRQIHAEFRSGFEFVREINEAANSLTSQSSIGSSDLQQLLIASLFLRSLTTYQSTILVIERGLPAEGKILARSLLEILFRISAISKDIKYAEIYVNEDQILRRKLINKSKLLSEPLRSKFEIDKITKLKVEISDDINARMIEEKNSQWYAEQSGLSDFYHSAYSIFSISVHASARDLESHLILDKEKKIIGFEIGPNKTEIDLILITIAEAMIMIISSAKSIFPERALAMLPELREKLERLNAAINTK